MRRSMFEPNSALPPHGHVPPSEAMGWKSPVPYLFGGLAAMLGLIAFALLILACSYWKLSGYLDSSAGDSDAGEGKAGDDGGKEKTEAVLRNSVLVIMAGEAQPTFIAMPAAKIASCSCGDGGGEEVRGEKEVVEMVAGGGGGGGDDGGSSDEEAAAAAAEEKR